MFGKNKEEEKEEEIKPAAMQNQPDLTRLSAELEKLKAEFQSFSEVRASFTERFSRLSEQIGELRAMILDRDRVLQEIELKAVKAAELVETVQPDRLMVQTQKEDAKIEAIKANLEGNETIMNRIIEELKDIRTKLSFFRGIQEIQNLAEEVKKELIEIKKIEISTSISADKVDTIFSEIKTKFRDIEEFKDQLQEVLINTEQNTKEIESLKLRIGETAKKEEVDKLFGRIQRYTDALKELEKKSSLTKDVEKLKSLLEGIGE